MNNYPLFFKLKVVEYYLQRKVSIKELLNIFQISRGSLYNWINQYKNETLSEKESYDKISKYTEDIRIYIKEYVTKRKIFSYKKLIKVLKKKYEITASKTSIYEILNSMNITYKKMKHKLIYGNQEKLELKKQEFQKTIKKTNKDDIICVDETSVDTRSLPLYGWSIKGTKLNQEVNAYKKRYTVICAISNKKVIHYEIIKNSAKKEHFKQFMENLVRKNINGKKILLDNACIHHSKLVANYMDTTDNEFIFNVPYTPEYNPIEHLFSKLKNNIRKNLKLNSLKLTKIIKKTFENIQSVELNNYYQHSFTF